MEEKAFYIVWNPGVISSVKHKTLAEAVNESERLARKHVGAEFIVFKSIDKVIFESPIQLTTYID